MMKNGIDKKGGRACLVKASERGVLVNDMACQRQEEYLVLLFLWRGAKKVRCEQGVPLDKGRDSFRIGIGNPSNTLSLSPPSLSLSFFWKLVLTYYITNIKYINHKNIGNAQSVVQALRVH